MNKLIASMIAAAFLLTGSAMASTKPMHATKHVKTHAVAHKTHVQKMAAKKTTKNTKNTKKTKKPSTKHTKKMSHVTKSSKSTKPAKSTKKGKSGKKTVKK
ncbi:MAG: hypothetical protein JOZ59_00885 [Candidatus Eremiobacteraeota bacterium]|nr:hypothetical protein [Candidatus Eremiobacteraeota bacterium]